MLPLIRHRLLRAAVQCQVAVNTRRSFTHLVPPSQSFIDGKWVPAEDGSTFPIYNPASGEQLGSVPDMSAAETKVAIHCAKRAFNDWKSTTAKERSMILHKWNILIKVNREELARILTLEQGKPLSESLGEIDYGASYIQWYAEEAVRVQGDIIPSPSKTSRILITKEPIGVCGLITPWNFPSAMLLRKAGPALAVGCTVISKPAEDTPVSALALAKLAYEAGVPAGVFNVVTASRAKTPEVGRELCENPLVSTISFTGSTDVGKILLAQSASTVKRCSMELGGNAPFIVFQSADIDAAVQGAMASKFRNSGQTCVTANRFLVHDSVVEEFRDKLMTLMSERLVMGDGLNPATTQGPLINHGAVEKVSKLVQEAVSGGAKLMTGASDLSDRKGSFYEPTLLTDINENMSISAEEIFGPVLAIQRFHSEEEVVRIANSSPVGLAGYFYSRDLGQIWRVAEALEFGMVGVNEGAISSEIIPFGGVKQSGLGREGGKYGIDEYVELKYIRMGGL